MKRSAHLILRSGLGLGFALALGLGASPWLVPFLPGASVRPASAADGGGAAPTADAIAVPATQPSRGEVVRFVTLPGRIQANQQATLHAKVSGYLAELTVDKGDRVKKGQRLGQIEIPELSADLARFHAELSVAEQELARVAEALAKAPDLVVPQTVDDARGRVEIARAEVRRTETLLGYARLTAPFDGIVTARHVDPGAFIPAATAASRRDAAADGAAILTLMDFETVRVQVPVPELEAARVAVGQPFEFTVDVLGPAAVTTRVARHAYALDPKTQTMLVEADVPNPDLTLRPGMFVSARIGVDRHAEVWTLPFGAVLVEKATRSILVVEGGVARKRTVETGFEDGLRYEIAKGVSGGETVLVPGAIRIADGDAVRTEAMR